MSGVLAPQDVVEQALAASRADGCVVIADASSSANLRWAGNTLTTNGVMTSQSVTVISTVDGAQGTAAGVLARSAVDADSLTDLVRAAEQAARDAGPAEDAQPLVDAGATPGWDDPPERTEIAVLGPAAVGLGEAFARARTVGRLLYGFAEHEVSTTYVGSSAGTRLRHVQPTGHLGITAKPTDLGASAWVGQATRDYSDVDVAALDDELVRRLGWAARRVELPAGRYETLLPPTTVADLMIYAYWTMGARDAHEGSTVYSRPGAGTKVGEKIAGDGVTLRSDPAYPGLQCAPFEVVAASSGYSSVFDNGLPVGATSWVADGELRSLITSRATAELTGLPISPGVDNLVLDVAGGAGDVGDLVAGVERGLLLTCLWYIREVDPATLLLTGLTRDGVYLVEGGEVVGAVNNFRFNESPVDLLGRIAAAGATVPAISREWGDYFPRTAMPALRIPDFHMSTVSDAL